ncbi:MAG: OsmC family protein, partial [Pseudomonadota bacterium]
KPIWTFRVHGRQETKTKSVVTARNVEMIIDEPIERGGTNLGPMPVETMIAGLVGCTHVISNKLATANSVTITAMDIDVVTTMDSSGTRLIQPVDIPFPDVTLTITADMDGPDAGIAAVVSKLRHHCAVSRMLQMSGSRVSETWIINGQTWNTEAA